MSIHIIVCIKSVVQIAPRGVTRRTPDNSELNPFDRPAIEAALQLKEACGGHVTALTMGPPVALEALAEARAMGVDRAVLITDRALAESDTLVTARVLARGIRKIGPSDLVIFGTRTADSDTGQVGPQTAALLDLPFVSRVTAVAKQANGWEVTRTMDMWEETWMIRPPAALTIDLRGYTPRALGLGEISAVYDDAVIDQWNLNDLDMEINTVGLAGSPTRVASLAAVKRERRCQMLDGDPREQAQALVEQLTRAGLGG